MKLLTLDHFDQLHHAVVGTTTGDANVDNLCDKIGLGIMSLKEMHLAVITELLTMYDSASEHNVDIGRRAIFDLAQRLAGLEHELEDKHPESIPDIPEL